jgi:hypothetical protein
MSGVTGVLLSYGGDSPYIPPWAPDFTMTNVDTAFFAVNSVLSYSAMLGEISYQGTLSPYPGGIIGTDNYYADPYTDPLIDFTNYYDVDWASACNLWGESWSAGSSQYPYNGSISFNNIVSEYPTQTLISGEVIFKWSTSYGIPSPSSYVLVVTPYTGGSVVRTAYSSGQLTNSGGVAGTPANISGDYYTYDFEGNLFLTYTKINYIYHKPTKTLYLQVVTETIPA